MTEIKLNVAGVGNDGGMLVRLDDVKSIFQSQQERIAELEKERDDYKTGNIEAKEFIQSHIRDPLTGHIYPRKAYCPMTELAIRDLEQQIKGVEDAKEFYSHKWSDEFVGVVVNIMKKGEGYIYPEGLSEYASQLRNQAKALKEQGDD
tara:strand:- start:278 stop:721 length:444 start_codon:yes stop_codon:yes gene_type:complete